MQIPSRSSIPQTILLAVVCIAWTSHLGAADLDATAKELVAQLGHIEFAMRERAAAKLIALELDAMSALEAGRESPDREVRQRCTKLLVIVAEIDLQRRYELFKKATDPEQDYGLSGWDAYHEVVGDSPTARSIFVLMHKDESRLMGMIDGNRRRLSKALSDRCEQLRGQAMFGRAQVRLGTSAALLFLATQDGITPTPFIQSAIYMACDGTTYKVAVESGPSRNVMAALTERWIARESLRGITYALHLGLSNGLEGSLLRAREVFESPVTTSFDRSYACLCLAKFGDDSDISRLESYLTNADVTTRAQINGQIVVTKVQDVALASLVHLTKQDHKDYGFDRLVTDRRLVFNLQSLGFRDEQRRTAAIAAWHAFQQQEKVAP